MQSNQKVVYIHKAKGLSDQFTIIPNSVAQNANLSWAARGLLVYLLSLPENWKVKKTELQRNAKTGREGTTSAFNELINLGYIKLEIIPGSFSKPPENIYTVYSEPIYDLREAVNRKAVNGKSVDGKSPYGKSVDGKSAAEKPSTTKYIPPKEIPIKNTEESKHTQSVCEFSFEKIFEMAFDSEFMRNLNEAHWGREVVEIQLERFKIKVRSSPEKYKTHNHESMRNAFIYHLGNHTRGNANGTQPELTKRQLNRQLNKQDPTKIIC